MPIARGSEGAKTSAQREKRGASEVAQILGFAFDSLGALLDGSSDVAIKALEFSSAPCPKITIGGAVMDGLL